jgi:hypothetical protein
VNNERNPVVFTGDCFIFVRNDYFLLLVAINRKEEDRCMTQLEDLSRETLIKIVRLYAKNWLAHDGCWFLGIEEAHDLETAIRFDAKAWERFTVIEAQRIMETFCLPKKGGLQSLAEALQYRLYAQVNDQEITPIDDKTLLFRMMDCRVQSARKRKNLDDFPCKPVGIVEYSGFASTIDPRIRTKCIACPPDHHPKDFWCAWEFTVD